MKKKRDAFKQLSQEEKNEIEQKKQEKREKLNAIFMPKYNVISDRYQKKTYYKNKNK